MSTRRRYSRNAGGSAGRRRKAHCSKERGRDTSCGRGGRRAWARHNAASRSASPNALRVVRWGWLFGRSGMGHSHREIAGPPLYQKDGTIFFSLTVPLTDRCPMDAVRIGCARCSTDRRDLTAQRSAPLWSELASGARSNLHRSRPDRPDSRTPQSRSGTCSRARRRHAGGDQARPAGLIGLRRTGDRRPARRSRRQAGLGPPPPTIRPTRWGRCC